MHRLFLFKSSTKALPISFFGVTESLGIEVFETTQLETLEKELKFSKVDLLYLYLDEEFPTALVDILTRSRNLSHFRRGIIFSHFKSFNPSSIRSALLSGSKEVYLDEISFNVFKKDISYHLFNKKRPFQIEKTFTPIGGMFLKITTYGRFGKISKTKIGVVHGECNVLLKNNQKIKIHSNIGLEWPETHKFWKVDNGFQNNLYFRYGKGYQFSFEDIDELIFKSWFKDAKNEFVLPKSKVLWVSKRPLIELEKGVESKIFSLYALERSSVTVGEFERMEPLIVIFDDEESMAILNDVQPKRKPFIIKTFKGQSEGIYIDCSDPWEFWKTVLNETKDFLSKRIKESTQEFAFINRHSKYSRFSLEWTAQLLEISNNHIIIYSDTAVLIDSILQIDFNCMASGHSLFVRIDKIVEKGTFSQEHNEIIQTYNLEGTILPFSENPMRMINYFGLLKVSAKQAGIDIIPKDPFHYFLWNIEQFFKIKHIILLFVALGIVFYILFGNNKRVLRKETPVSTEQFMESVNQSFK